MPLQVVTYPQDGTVLVTALSRKGAVLGDGGGEKYSGVAGLLGVEWKYWEGELSSKSNSGSWEAAGSWEATGSREAISSVGELSFFSFPMILELSIFSSDT